MRNIRWRAAGCACLIGGFGLSAFCRPDGLGAIMAVAGFGLVILGLLLVVQGRHVAAAIRVERSRHRDLPLAIHGRRIRASRQQEKVS